MRSVICGEEYGEAESQVTPELDATSPKYTNGLHSLIGQFINYLLD